jgi:hypothetical protein
MRLSTSWYSTWEIEGDTARYRGDIAEIYPRYEQGSLLVLHLGDRGRYSET